MNLKTPIQLPVWIDDSGLDRELLGLPEINFKESVKQTPTIFFSINAIEPYENYEDVYVCVISGGQAFHTAIKWEAKDQLMVYMGIYQITHFNG